MYTNKHGIHVEKCVKNGHMAVDILQPIFLFITFFLYFIYPGLALDHSSFHGRPSITYPIYISCMSVSFR